MLAGLVPGIAAALGVSLAQAGYLTSAFALGMVAGAPLMAALARAWRRRTALLCFLALFAATHVIGDAGRGAPRRRVRLAVGVLGRPAVPARLRRRVADPRHPGGREAGGPACGAGRAASADRRLVLAALVNAATFGVFTYLAPLADGVAPVPVVLAAFGTGCFAGVTAAGRLADRSPGRLVAAGGGLLLSGWVTLALTAQHPAVLAALAFAQGALSFAVGSTVITRILHLAAGAPMMAGSSATATATLNLGAMAGPVVGGAVLAVVNPFWVAAGLIAAALLPAVPLRGKLRHRRRRT
jgi:DHA1 family chloramphenicol resistance protein-like MFS transporter